MMAGFGSAARASLRAAVVFACLTTFGTFAASGAQTGVAASDTITVYTSDAPAMVPGGAAARLVQRARQLGQVRVIVMLRIVMRMEHTLSGREVVRQRSALRSVQDAVATRVLGSPSHPDVVKFDAIPAMSLFVNATELRTLLSDPNVVSISEDMPIVSEATDSIALIHADDVFAKGFNGTGYVIAVPDKGVAKSHPVFANGAVAGGKVVSEACYGTITPAAGISSFCPGGAASSTAPGSGVNCPLATGCYHGTHDASIAARNSSISDGIARDAKLIAIQIYSRQANCAPNPSPCTVGDTTNTIRALQRVYALRNTYKIAAVNMSFGGAVRAAPCDAENAAYTMILNNLRAAGIAPIKSAGNNGSNNGVTYPGCITSTIPVANSNGDDQLDRSSNISPMVQLAAPGTDINGAMPGNKYKELTGTSMAAPHVAGAYAVLKNAKPTATVDDILAALKCSGKPIDTRAVAGNPEVTPVVPRIDLLGAYNRLKKPAGATRSYAFNSADDAKDWRPFRGVWNTTGGKYQPTVQSAWLMSSVPNCDSKLDVTVTMKRIDRTVPNPADARFTTVWNSGVWLKTTLDYGAETINSGYFFAFNKLWWCAESPPFGDPCPSGIKQGNARILKTTSANNAETGTGMATLLCQKNMPIVVNGFNTLRIISNGSTHAFFLNGTLVCRTTDPAFTSGAVVVSGFIPCQSGSPPACAPQAGHQLQVDSVSIKSLETAPAVVAVAEAVMDPTAFAATPIEVATGSASQGQVAIGVASSQ
jgi:subtilisin family serine protease